MTDQEVINLLDQIRNRAILAKNLLDNEALFPLRYTIYTLLEDLTEDALRIVEGYCQHKD